MQNISEVKFDEISGRSGNLGIITLNRPQALNALNHAMFIAIDQQLTEWENAKHIKAVIIRAVEGKAFCAGGDIRHAYELKKSNDNTLIDFFGDEYRMNSHIHHYKKPYIALLDGITMGGGAGVSIHGSHRIATQKLVFAMPETGIGFYPDVGATYFLAQLPHHIGFYLGLTGARINHEDCFSLGLVDIIVKSEDFPAIIHALADADFQDNAKEIVTGVLKQYVISCGESALLQYRGEISECFSKKSVEEIVHALKNHKNIWCHEVASILEKKSPTSLKVTLKALQDAAHLTFDECMQIEYRLTSRFIEGHDFFEGIRAVLIDKDQKPQWKPAALEEVTQMHVSQYFAPQEIELTVQSKN